MSGLLSSWAVPRGAVRVERPVADEIAAYMHRIGVTIPPPGRFALRWHGDDHEFIDQVDDDQVEVLEADGWLVTEYFEVSVDDLAHIVTGMVEDRHRRHPHALSWRRWPVTDWLVRRLHGLGVVAGFSTGSDGRDPVGGWTIGHVRFRGRRTYVLGKPDWWWRCQRDQGWTLRRHRPERPWAFGVCAACVPCRSCGAHRECRTDCPEVTS